jgi:uncharacterized membrane protein YebE (DUF533 family)
MFDPKVLLDAILAGGAKPAASAQQAAPEGSGIGDILRKLGQVGGQGGGQGGGQSAPSASGGSGLPGGLGDILGQVFGKAGGAQGEASGPPAGGGIGDVLGQIFGQAKQGVSEGAGRVDEAIGARQKIDDLLKQVTGGQGGAEAIEKLKKMAADNQLGAGAVIGALGGLVLGTKTGRGLAVDAAKLGGLVLIGGLAYKAYQNYSEGKPPLGGGQALHTPAPGGSGFEADAQTGDHALLYVRAMIAAAAADGQIDQGEQQQILGGLQQMGLGAEATQFLRQEISNPASVEDLVAAATSPEVALQVYTAARVAIEPDTREEQAFLHTLAQGLGVDAKLAAHIDAEATKLKV